LNELAASRNEEERWRVADRWSPSRRRHYTAIVMD
jgi:hypothetical protein